MLQAVTVAGAGGGTFTLGLNGDVSEPIAWNAGASVVRARLEHHTRVNNVTKVKVSRAARRGDGYTWRVTLIEADWPLPLLEADVVRLFYPSSYMCIKTSGFISMQARTPRVA